MNGHLLFALVLAASSAARAQPTPPEPPADEAVSLAGRYRGYGAAGTLHAFIDGAVAFGQASIAGAPPTDILRTRIDFTVGLFPIDRLALDLSLGAELLSGSAAPAQTYSAMLSPTFVFTKPRRGVHVERPIEQGYGFDDTRWAPYAQLHGGYNHRTLGAPGGIQRGPLAGASLGVRFPMFDAFGFDMEASYFQSWLDGVSATAAPVPSSAVERVFLFRVGFLFFRPLWIS